MRERVVSWLVNHHADFGATLELVSDATQEGAQFCKGLGGCCGTLQRRVRERLGGCSGSECLVWELTD